MKIHLFSAAVLAIATSAAYGQSQPVQWRVEDGGNGHWYQVVLTPNDITFAAAAVLATQRGGYLFSGCGQEFDSAIAITQALSPTAWVAGPFSQWTGPWIGLQLVDDMWTWSDGTTCGFDRWDTSASQPDSPATTGESVAFLYTVGAGPAAVVHDVPATRTTRSFLMEWSADCNGDGIVDYGQCRDGSLPDYNGNNVPDCCETGTPCEVGSYPVQWRVEDGGNGHWYQFVAGPTCWSDAVALADSRFGHLATFTSPSEQAFMMSRLPNLSQAWIGGLRDPGTDVLSGWRWVTGEPWSSSAVMWGEDNPGCCFPDEFFLSVWTGFPTGVHDVPACYSVVFGAAIEWSADCNNDGLVDYGQILSGQLADANGDGVPNICQCPGDITGNDIVDGVDLAAILGAWGTDGQNQYDCDIDGDGIVGGTDLAYVLGGWGPCQ